MSKIITFNDKSYPAFQAQGNAAQFAIPFAKHYCTGVGVDIGCNRVEWSFPGSIPVDPAINQYSASNLPRGDLDYIFSSHCLEHLPHWVDALDFWIANIKPGGSIFLYLPHYDQEYWRPWNNRKHIHCFTPNIICDYMISRRDLENVFTSQRDLNNSFIAVAQKRGA